MPALIPELYVDDLNRSIDFYAAIGFAVLYARPTERFAVVERDGVCLMLEEPIGRVFGGFDPTIKRGAGINLQITISNLDALTGNLPEPTPIVLPIETRRYQRLADEVTVRHIVVADPDGYLLRFSQTMGFRPVHPPATP